MDGPWEGLAGQSVGRTDGGRAVKKIQAPEGTMMVGQL